VWHSAQAVLRWALRLARTVEPRWAAAQPFDQAHWMPFALAWAAAARFRG
jgi:hypothetical protein